MSNVPVPMKTGLPASIAKLVAIANDGTPKELSGGVQSGFGVLSFKGKVWAHRKGGERVQFLDPDGNAVPSLDVVLVRSNPQPAKTFYEAAFEEGSTEAPRCWSADGMKPDSGVPHPVSKTCANCPNNVWGSKITPSGKKTRACSDVRRLAVVSLADLDQNAAEAQPVLLRVPPASLNPLKDYGEKTLEPKGIPYFAVVTRIGFNPQAAHPQLTFRAVRFLSEEQAESILALRESADVKRILAAGEEFVAGETEASADVEAGGTAAAVPTQAQPATASKSSPAPKSPKPRAASEEEAGLEIAQPAEPAGGDELAIGEPEVAVAKAVAATKPAKKAAAPKPVAKPIAAPAPVEAIEEAEAEVPAAGAESPPDFDDMLAKLLGS